MFGYVIVNQNSLDEEQIQRYKQCYCGLCHSLKNRNGQLSRLMLTFDLTFLALLLNALYGYEEKTGDNTCPVHPFRKQKWWASEMTAYAADMTVLLGYQKLQDDWNDDCNPIALWGSLPFKSKYKEIKEKYPRQSVTLEECMAELSAMEIHGIEDPDKASALFGKIMAEVFVYREDFWSDTLRNMGRALGQFIYLIDAVVDREKDIRTGNYNPLKSFPDARNDHYREMLEMLLGEVVFYYDKLPIVEDNEIIKNVLCSGVWTEYVKKFYPEEKDKQ